MRYSRSNMRSVTGWRKWERLWTISSLENVMSVIHGASLKIFLKVSVKDRATCMRCLRQKRKNDGDRGLGRQRFFATKWNFLDRNRLFSTEIEICGIKPLYEHTVWLSSWYYVSMFCKKFTWSTVCTMYSAAFPDFSKIRRLYCEICTAYSNSKAMNSRCVWRFGVYFSPGFGRWTRVASAVETILHFHHRVRTGVISLHVTLIVPELNSFFYPM